MRSALCSLSGQSVRPATLQHVLALVLHHELRTLSTLPTRSTALPGRPTGLGLPGLPYRQFHTTLHGQDLAKPRALYPERKAAYVLAGFPVYLGGLPLFWGEEHVNSLIAKVGGDVEGVHVPPIKEGVPQYIRYAFVHYKNQADAQKAVSELDGYDIGVRKISASFPRNKHEQAARQGLYGQERHELLAEAPVRLLETQLVPTGAVSRTNLFVANIPWSVKESELAEVFMNQSFKVKTVRILRMQRQTKYGRPYWISRGQAYVDLEDPAQQREAVNTMSGHKVGDREISVRIASEVTEVPVGETQGQNASATPESSQHKPLYSSSTPPAGAEPASSSFQQGLSDGNFQHQLPHSRPTSVDEQGRQEEEGVGKEPTL